MRKLHFTARNNSIPRNCTTEADPFYATCSETKNSKTKQNLKIHGLTFPSYASQLITDIQIALKCMFDEGLQMLTKDNVY